MFPITIAITRLLKKKPNEYLITTHEVNKEACDQIVVTLRDKFGNDIGSNVINITPTNINTGDYWIVISHGLTVEIDYPKILNVISGLRYINTRVTNKTISEKYLFRPVEDYSLTLEERKGTLSVIDRTLSEYVCIAPSIPDDHEYIHTNDGVFTGPIVD